MIPILYEANATAANLQTNGLGRLAETISYTVTEERNGDYTLTLTYPVTGAKFAEIQVDRIIGAKPNDDVDIEYFRIFAMTAQNTDTMQIEARQVALDVMRSNAIYTYNEYNVNLSPQVVMNRAWEWFTPVLDLGQTHRPTFPTLNFASDITTPIVTMANQIIRPFFEIIVGMDGSIVDMVGGELQYSGYNVALKKARGRDNGVRIAYGKNITGIRQEIDMSNITTALAPYYPQVGEWGTWAYAYQDDVVYNQYDGIYGHSYIRPFDVSGLITVDQYSEEPPEIDDIVAVARGYMERNPEIGLPDVTITVSFVPLWQTEEYKDLAALEKLSLCDTVTVYFPSLGVDKKAKVVKTVYDGLNERYTSIEVGTLRQTLAQTIANIKKGR